MSGNLWISFGNAMELYKSLVYVREVNPPDRFEYGPLLTLGVFPGILLILGAALVPFCLHTITTCCN